MSVFKCLEKLRVLRILGEVRICIRESVVSSTFGSLRRLNLSVEFWSIGHDRRNILLQYFRRVFLVMCIACMQSLRA